MASREKRSPERSGRPREPWVGASSATQYTAILLHDIFGGHTDTVGVDTVSVLVNDTPLDGTFEVDMRSFDINGNGLVDVVDFAAFGAGFQSPPKPYWKYLDFNDDGLVELVDFSLFGPHIDHLTTAPKLLFAPGQKREIDGEVKLAFTEEYVSPTDRRLYVDLEFSSFPVFKAMCLAFGLDRSDLMFKEWKQSPTRSGLTIVAPIVRNGNKEIFCYIEGSASRTHVNSDVGRYVFKIDTDKDLKLGESDFAVNLCDVLLEDGDQGTITRTTSANRSEIVRTYHNSLAQNYPNPFNPTTTISYSIQRLQTVRLAIYNVAGQLVRTLVNEDQPPGVYKMSWNGENNTGHSVASGVYFYRLRAGDYVATKKMVLLK